MSYNRNRVHLMDGFAPAGTRVRAVCTCGWATTPRAREVLAFDALHSEHGVSRPECRLCGRYHGGQSWERIRNAVQILRDGLDGEFLVCRGMPVACREESKRRLDDATREFMAAFGIPYAGE
jgi:hypothetical protein